MPAVVTGALSGLGVETARTLAATGAEVTLVVRGIEAGERAVTDITAVSDSTALHVAPLDLADPASISAFTWAGDGITTNALIKTPAQGTATLVLLADTRNRCRQITAAWLRQGAP